MSMGFPSDNIIIEENDNLWQISSENCSDSSRSSSTQSWLDENEASVTKELQDQYDKFEAALYAERDTTDLPKFLQEEVKIWSEHSPHIRVCGVKANLHTRPDNLEEEEIYDSNYEEIIESHGSLEECIEKTITFNDEVREVIEHCPSVEKDIIKEDIKNAIVDKLFDHAWPKVLEKFEPVIKSLSAGKKKRITQNFEKPEMYLEILKNQKNQKNVTRSSSSRSYMREMLTRKPYVDSLTEHRSLLSSRGLRRLYKGSDHPPSEISMNITTQKTSPRTNVNRISNLMSNKSNGQPMFGSKNTSHKKPLSRNKEQEKRLSLPRIEALAITPMVPDERSVSAMVKFTKTLPRVRPDASKKKVSKSASSKESNLKSSCSGISRRMENDTLLGSDLQVVGTRSATTAKNNKWRY